MHGSRSRDDFTEDSDYDFMGFRDQGPRVNDARMIDGKFLDAFVYPVSEVIGQEENFLRVRRGRILRDTEGFGRNLVDSLERIFKRGPPPMLEDEVQMIRIWIQKMLNRIVKEDVEANYRRAWLQFELLELFFKLRGKWYPGPRESFAWLAVHEPEVHGLFETALRPGSSRNLLFILSDKVLELSPNESGGNNSEDLC